VCVPLTHFIENAAPAPKGSLYSDLRGLRCQKNSVREKVSSYSSSFSGHMGGLPGSPRATLDEGYCTASGPCGTPKQILHSINLHLFAHPCCQWLLSREAANMQGKEFELRSSG
jgi:hypothetical protein